LTGSKVFDPLPQLLRHDPRRLFTTTHAHETDPPAAALRHAARIHPIALGTLKPDALASAGHTEPGHYSSRSTRGGHDTIRTAGILRLHNSVISLRS
jgi:hypothetical protein